MAAEWRRHVTFAELVDEGTLEIGDGYRAKNEELGGSGPIFLRAGHVTDTHIDFEGVERFHAELEPRLTSKMSKAGDAIITTKGNSTGRTSYVSLSMPRFVYSPHLSYWRARDRSRIDGGFLHYWSKGEFFRGQLLGMKTSTDMAPYLSLTDQRKLSIALPPINEQRSIAHILGTLDDRIEANRRMAAGQEEMARALFQSWFVRFDPVRAKMEGRWRKGESLPGLPAALHDLFPAHLMETEHGQIPEGWSSCQLAEITTALSGGTPSKADGTLWDGGIPWLSPKSMTSLHATETPETVTPAAIGRGTRLAPTGAIFVMVRGMGLHQGLRVSQARREMAFNQDVKALIPEAVSSEFLLFGILSQSKGLHSKVKAAGHGTGVLETDILLGTRICCPRRNIARELSAPLKSANEKLAVCEAQNNTLASIRDALLPKLVSGAIRVKDAEAFLKERGL
jgi:type I restriction enzyme S subunit